MLVCLLAIFQSMCICCLGKGGCLWIWCCSLQCKVFECLRCILFFWVGLILSCYVCGRLCFAVPKVLCSVVGILWRMWCSRVLCLVCFLCYFWKMVGVLAIILDFSPWTVVSILFSAVLLCHLCNCCCILFDLLFLCPSIWGCMTSMSESFMFMAVSLILSVLMNRLLPWILE